VPTVDGDTMRIGRVLFELDELCLALAMARSLLWSILGEGMVVPEGVAVIRDRWRG